MGWVKLNSNLIVFQKSNKYKADITALDENVSGLMVEIENFKRVLGKLYGVSTNNTGGVGLPGQVRRLIQA
jgi:hypothetical protein